MSVISFCGEVTPWRPRRATSSLACITYRPLPRRSGGHAPGVWQPGLRGRPGSAQGGNSATFASRTLLGLVFVDRVGIQQKDPWGRGRSGRQAWGNPLSVRRSSLSAASRAYSDCASSPTSGRPVPRSRTPCRRYPGRATHAMLSHAVRLPSADDHGLDGGDHRCLVTNQVTTMPGSGRRNSTCSDTDILLNCGDPTERDVHRRSRHVW
jgi:hypothetical protein